MRGLLNKVLWVAARQLQGSVERKRGRDVLAAARGLVARELGPEAGLEPRGDVVRGATLKCALTGVGPDLPGSVFIKGAKPAGRGAAADPDDRDPQSSSYRLFNAWAGPRFLGQTCGEGEVCPRWVAGDRDLGVLVTEDVGDTSLDEVLAAGDPGAAERALLDMARILGRIHAATRGKRQEYEAIRASLGPLADPADVWGTGPWLRTMVDSLRKRFAHVGFTADEDFYEELDATVRALEEPGPFLVYTHNDLCPDNACLTRRGARLIDFEHGGFRHAMTDGAYVRMLFPTCWRVNRVPHPVVVRMEEEYRAGLVQGCPEASDDEAFRRALGHGCAYWLTVTLTFAFGKPEHRLDRTSALEADQPWGLATLREIVLGRIEAFLDASEELDVLPRMRETCLRLRDHLVHLWDPEGVSPFPAFRGDGKLAADPVTVHPAP